MSRKRTDQICDLWEADPRQITEAEAITFSLQTIREYEQRLEACEEENTALENRIEILRKAVGVQDKNYQMQQEAQQNRIASLEQENQALKKALVAQERLAEMQNRELNFEVDLSLIELQQLVQNGFEEMEAENMQLRKKLKALDRKVKRMQAHTVGTKNYLLRFSIPVKVIERAIAKGGKKDDDATGT